MHKEEIEVAVSSTTGPLAFPKCYLICGVITPRQRRIIRPVPVIPGLKSHCDFSIQGHRKAIPWLAEFFKPRVNAGKQYPVGNRLHSAPIAKAANLGQMAAADSYIAKGPSPGVPLRIVARDPAFDDPRFSTDDSLGKATHRSNAVLDVNDSSQRRWFLHTAP